jgi:hypothetical protein
MCTPEEGRDNRDTFSLGTMLVYQENQCVLLFKIKKCRGERRASLASRHTMCTYAAVFSLGTMLFYQKY